MKKAIPLGSEIIFIKFDIRQLIRAWIIAFFDDDTLRHAVTFTFNWLTLKVRDTSSFMCMVKVCTNFERNRAIPGWNIDNFANFYTRYVKLWPWPLPSWPWTCTHFDCHVFKLCTKFERNRIIHG